MAVGQSPTPGCFLCVQARSLHPAGERPVAERQSRVAALPAQVGDDPVGAEGRDYQRCLASKEASWPSETCHLPKPREAAPTPETRAGKRRQGRTGVEAPWEGPTPSERNSLAVTTRAGAREPAASSHKWVSRAAGMRAKTAGKPED